MKYFKRISCLLLTAYLLVAAPAGATLIAYWDFNDSDLLVDQGAGTLTLSHASGLAQVFAPGSTQNTVGATPAGFALGLEAVNLGGSYEFLFSVDMTGYADLNVSFAYRGDPSWRTGANGTQITYYWSANGGGSFTPLFQGPPPANFVTEPNGGAWSTIPALDDNPDVVVRFFQSPSQLTTGERLLFDNVQIHGTPTSTSDPLPAPPSALLLAAGIAMLLLVRRPRVIRNAQVGQASAL